MYILCPINELVKFMLLEAFAGLFSGLAICVLNFAVVFVGTFFPGQGERVEKLFRKCTLSGLRFMVGAVFALAGVLKGTDILDASPLTHLYLGVLNVVGLLGFLLGGLVGSRSIFLFDSFLAISARLAMMGLCSAHLIFADRYGFIVLLMSPLYVLLMIFQRSIANMMKKHVLGVVTTEPQTAQLSQTDHEIFLEGMARDGVTYTPMIGIALLAVFYMGDDMKHTSTPIWIAYYNFGAFWMYQGAMLLERGLLFETWVVGGMIMSLAMILSGLMSIFTPTPNHPIILILTAVLVISHLKVDWIKRNLVDRLGTLPQDAHED
ncbi:hypothetical protein Tco_0390080 [Tanacetum coccineum]